MKGITAVLILLMATGLGGCLDDDSDLPNAAEDSAQALDADVGAYPIWAALEEAQIQPGASLGGFCTFNFLFEAPNGTGYIGTAGHCTEEIGERVELPGLGEIGTVVYDSDLVESGVDFSLIELDDEAVAQANPKMLGWDGPTGYIEPANLTRGDVIQLHGYGLLLGQNDYTRDRWGVLVDWNDDEYNVDMPAVNGDSGSPLMHESGLAFGIISRYGFENVPPSTDQGPLMGYIFRELAAAGWEEVRLATV